MDHRSEALDRLLPVSLWAWAACGLLCAGLGLAAFAARAWMLAPPALVFGALALLGLRDVAQSRHSSLVNCPVIGHLSFLL